MEDERVVLALDVDGVLLDPARDGRGPWQTAFSERFSVDAGDLDDTLFATSWADVIVGRRSVESALGEALSRLGWQMGVEPALQCWFDEDYVLEPTVVAAAKAWSDRGISLVLVSNQEPRRARYLQDRVAHVLPIRGVAFSGDLGVVKTDPDFYVRAERHLGVTGSGSSIAFLDDTAANIDVAVRHGWAGVHFTKDGDWHAALDAALARPS